MLRGHEKSPVGGYCGSDPRENRGRTSSLDLPVSGSRLWPCLSLQGQTVLAVSELRFLFPVTKPLVEPHGDSSLLSLSNFVFTTNNWLEPSDVYCSRNGVPLQHLRILFIAKPTAVKRLAVLLPPPSISTASSSAGASALILPVPGSAISGRHLQRWALALLLNYVNRWTLLARYFPFQSLSQFGTQGKAKTCCARHHELRRFDTYS